MTNREKDIFKRLTDHYKEALEYFPEDRIVGVFLQGSQNYGLDIEGSDVDTKLIVLPTLDDICFNKKAVSTTHVRENDEHIDFKDIRLMFQTFRKQNLNFVEILFTEFKIVNPMYADLWQELVDNNEMIAHYNPYAAVKTMKGIAMEKYHAMEHEYPSKLHILDKYGYDPKQLHHLFRVEEYLLRYIKGTPYAECLISDQPDFLKHIKQGAYTLGDARWMGKATLDRVTQAADEFCEANPANPNPEVDKLLDKIQAAIVKRSIKKSVMEE